MANKVYEIVTERIIEKLQQGEIPWHMPWSNELPKNLKSGKTYRGINVFLLGSMGYSNPYWLTYNQANDLGGHVKKGEKSTMVVFWKMWDRENKSWWESKIRLADQAPAHVMSWISSGRLSKTTCFLR